MDSKGEVLGLAHLLVLEKFLPVKETGTIRLRISTGSGVVCVTLELDRRRDNIRLGISP